MMHDRNCDYCGKNYHGQGRMFCSRRCSMLYALDHKIIDTTKTWNKGLKGWTKKYKYAGFQKGHDNFKGAEKGWFSWKTKSKHNYVRLIINGKRYPIHRYIIEQHLGRKLKRTEIVHHKNGDKSDNRIENLEVMTQAEHAKKHLEEERYGIKN